MQILCLFVKNDAIMYFIQKFNCNTTNCLKQFEKLKMDNKIINLQLYHWGTSEYWVDQEQESLLNATKIRKINTMYIDSIYSM